MLTQRIITITVKLREESFIFCERGLKVPKYGQAELVEAETSFTTYQEFQSMLTRDRIDIFMVGEFDLSSTPSLHRFPLEEDVKLIYSLAIVNLMSML